MDRVIVGPLLEEDTDAQRPFLADQQAFMPAWNHKIDLLNHYLLMIERD